MTPADELGADSEGPSFHEDRRVTTWAAVVVGITICLSIGTPLLGARVFLGTDLLQSYAPWSDAAPNGFRPNNRLLNDTVDAFVPMRALIRRGVLNGHFPLWNPYQSAGVPVGTLPDSGSLSPMNLPYFLVPLWYAPGAAKLLEMAVAAGFTFLFLRRLGLGRAAALIGGLAYMNSGFQVGWTNWPQAEVGALIPALFWAVERSVQVRTVRTAAILAAVVAAMILTGFPQVTLMALGAAAAYLLVRAWVARDLAARRRIWILGLIGGGVLLGAGIAALQLVPFRQQLGVVNLAYRDQLPASHVSPRALVTMAIPNALGSPVDDNYFGFRGIRRAGYEGRNDHEAQSFIGASALLLVIVGAARIRSTSNIPRGVRAYLWVGTALAAVLIYHGGALLGMLQHLSFFRTNFIGRLRAVFLFFVASLAAMGFQALVDRGRNKGRRAWPLLVWSGAAVASLVVAASVWRVAGLYGQRAYVVRHSIIPIAAAAVTLGVIVLRSRWEGVGGRWKDLSSRLPFLAIPAVMAIESLAFVVPYWPRTSKALFYPTPPAIRFLQANVQEGRVASSRRVLLQGTMTYYGIRSVTSHAFQDRTWLALLRAANGGRYVGSVYTQLPALPDVATSPVLDLLGARFFVTDPSDPVFGSSVAPPRPAGTVQLRPSVPVVTTIPAGDLRAVGVQVTVGEIKPDPGARLLVEVLDGSGRVVTVGSRRLGAPLNRGLFTVPVVEVEAGTGGASPSVRVTLQGSAESIPVSADAQGKPSLSLVRGGGDGLRLVFVKGAQIYRRLGALPRIRWAGRSEVVEDSSERLFVLSAPVAPDVVVLNEPGTAGSGKSATVRVLRDGDDEVRATVSANGAGYLVVADSLQHGWKAYVDGRPVRLLFAEHALAAVPVPAGRHEVSVRYDPKSWRVGLIISAISVVVLLGALIYPWPKRRRDPDPAA